MHDEPTNEQRANRILKSTVLEAYVTARGDMEDEESDLADLITDCLHAIARKRMAGDSDGLDPCDPFTAHEATTRELMRATSNFDAEWQEEHPG